MEIRILVTEGIVAIIFLLVALELLELTIGAGIAVKKRLGINLLIMAFALQIVSAKILPIPIAVASMAFLGVPFSNKPRVKEVLLCATALFVILFYTSSIFQISLIFLRQGKVVHLLFLYLALVIRDTGAAVYGSFFPGKVITELSPRKTWQGSLTGLVAAEFLWLVAANWLQQAYIYAFAQGMIVGVVGQIGDLLASALKRASDSRHSGKLFGRWGGIVDLLDSFLFTLPFLYLFGNLTGIY